MARRGASGEHVSFGADAGKHVDAYWEYTRIVGSDDGGVPFTPEQYENYKREVLPMAEFFKNKLKNLVLKSKKLKKNFLF